MEKKVFDYIRRHHMIEEGDRVVVGVSGGADSLCLFFLLLELSKSLSFDMGVVHVNHMIRGEEAKRDAEYVKELCESHRIAYKLYLYDVGKIAKEGHMSVEEAGRKVRYEAFAQFAGEWNGNKIALAHHANDLAETFLHHLARGSGIRGLCAIRPVRSQVIRPLLCMKREEIEHYLKDRNICFLTDSTNSSLLYTRNKIRSKVIPYLEEEVNPYTVEHIAGAAETLCEAEDYLSRCAKRLFEKYVTVLPDGCRIEEGLFSEEYVLYKYVIRMCLERIKGTLKDITREHLEQVCALRDKEVGKEASLPGNLYAGRLYQGMLLTNRNGKELEIENKKTPMSMKWDIFSYKEQRIPENQYTKWFDYDRIKIGLKVRTRQTGDYLVINEQGGKKKLKDYFIDCKIPKEKRDEILLLADGSHIIWVVGYRISEHYKVNQNTKTVLRVWTEGG